MDTKTSEQNKSKRIWIIEKYLNRKDYEEGKPYEVSEFEGNIILDEGANAMWTLVAGGTETAFNAANSYLGVGDSNTAESATQTGLQATTNKLYKGMVTGYPQYGTSRQIVFKSQFDETEANFAWNEFTVANGNSDTAKNINRKVSAQGTKTSGQVWTLTLTIQTQ